MFPADEKDEMASADSVKFKAIFTQVESLHQLGMDDPLSAWKRDFRFFSPFRFPNFT